MAILTAIISGPLFGRLAAAGLDRSSENEGGGRSSEVRGKTARPSAPPCPHPAVGRADARHVHRGSDRSEHHRLGQIAFLGTPARALLITTVFAMVALGYMHSTDDFGAKALIENFVETGTKDNPSKFDFGPINTMVSSNYIDGTRLRLLSLRPIGKP